jgi:hypothetical protein
MTSAEPPLSAILPASKRFCGEQLLVDDGGPQSRIVQSF